MGVLTSSQDLSYRTFFLLSSASLGSAVMHACPAVFGIPTFWSSFSLLDHQFSKGPSRFSKPVHVRSSFSGDRNISPEFAIFQSGVSRRSREDDLGVETEDNKDGRHRLFLGILDISLSVAYGEGERIFRRLMEAIMQACREWQILAWAGPHSPFQANIPRSPLAYRAFDDASASILSPNYYIMDRSSKLGDHFSYDDHC
ncbi:hypothetical protein CY34DRAFT_808748 [Suillus luteus UH-Slu-Lm8-n1]|uniref:Uncharacterized protein n=1 Tax=Suillus luteus UH-Slu-Lm8-n1 TaxID=930992 RepID=A0A0D0B5D5_9AGAM|nr:hypothetical protein CY34DRAFT_808748 [Suillus luteus UH-Slu-Lm8-n1]